MAICRRQLASDHFKTLESLVKVLSKITCSLDRFVNYEQLFRTEPAVRKAVGTLYLDLLDFCTRTVRFHCRSAIRMHVEPGDRRVFNRRLTGMIVMSFDKDFSQVSDSIDFHSVEIDLVANAANVSES